MDAADIEGTQPGWRPRHLFVGQPRDTLRVDDISGAGGPGERRRAPLALPAGLPSSASAPCTARQQGVAAAGALPMPQPARCEQQAVPEFGVAYTVDWQRRRAEAKLREAEAARHARQAADAAIAAAAAKAAAAGCASAEQPAAAGSAAAAGGGGGGLAAVLKSLRVVDREGCGRVQVRGGGG